MGRNVPIINRDSDEVKEWLNTRIKEPQNQKRLVLIIVSIALLLDNMLYMVIVPIIPRYLESIGTYDVEYKAINKTRNHTVYHYDFAGGRVYLGEGSHLGFLFASKAIVQIFINPFSGTLIDRIGYEVPMIVGLMVMFMSTSLFALGQNYWVLFAARSLQGVGSAFADTAGLAMIADRFTEEHERSTALGVALAFISFGSLVAPPFGGLLYQLFDKAVPFLVLAIICLIDGFMVFMVIQPKQRSSVKEEPLQGTPIWQLFLDPYIATCSGALVFANISLAFLEPTITMWMEQQMPGVNAFQTGLIWLPAFLPHVLGVYCTIILLKRYPQQPWLLAAIGLAMEGISCFFVPFCKGSFWLLALPLCSVCFGIALVDTSLLPMLGYLVDTRHVSVYGSVYAIADISYSMAYACGPVIAGQVVDWLGFNFLIIMICLSNVLYAPMLSALRRAYVYKPFEEGAVGGGELQSLRGADTDGYGGGGMSTAKQYEDGALNGTGGFKGYGTGDAVGGAVAPGYVFNDPWAEPPQAPLARPAAPPQSQYGVYQPPAW